MLSVANRGTEVIVRLPIVPEDATALAEPVHAEGRRHAR